jgi:hypothetical protein
MRVVFLSFCAATSYFSAHYGAPLVRNNSDIITIIITVMTVFAGFLVAIISVLGDPAMIPKGSWRIAESRHKNLENVVIRTTAIFYLYLISIAFLFIGVLLEKSDEKVVANSVKTWIEFLYLFFSVFSFFVTLSLPRIVARIQMARSEAEIEARRVAEGIRQGR